MSAGFAAALAGDYFLAYLAAPRSSPEFLAGVACFTLAQILWAAGQLREARPDTRALFAAGVPLLVFAAVRLRPVLPTAAWVAVIVYSAITAYAFAVALAARRVFYGLGIGLLLVSDLMIGGRLLGAPGCGAMSGPLYAAAEAFLLVSFFVGGREMRWSAARRDVWGAALLGGGSGVLLFFLAALSYPGGGYNPLRQMLSSLGRTVIRDVPWPICHYLFTAGLMVVACAVARVWAHLARLAPDGWRRTLLSWGGAANVAGLCIIAFVPENVNIIFHNAGCHMAAYGGAGALFALDRPGRDRVWSIVLVSIVAAFGVCLALHEAKIVPFSPAVPTVQKILISAFTLWIGYLALRSRAAPLNIWRRIALVALIAVAAAAAALRIRGAPPPAAVEDVPTPPAAPSTRTLDADEQAALRWLEHIAAPLSQDEEKEWWAIGGRQYSILAKRYNIAFCGYAAAALALVGGEETRAAAGRIIGNCIDRYIRRDVWSYAASKSYWGRLPGPPDPCRRENVMYTGHLLQLLALYETFTGDKKYWDKGFDFVWDKNTKVHYTVSKLIDVTVRQMRRGPCGGVACEPGLVFFPCNNHPHIALALFSRLGHGDWTRDARRWEDWALANFRNPLFSGGIFNLVYHLRSGIFYPRGHNGLDGWSLLWYEPWARDRATPLALWREAAQRIDWSGIENQPDVIAGQETCCHPVDAPPAASATFLAAAARACDDASTAERLEKIASACIVRKDGMVFLDLNREWRIGATANYIIARAIANGARFRRLVKEGK